MRHPDVNVLAERNGSDREEEEVATLSTNWHFKPKAEEQREESNKQIIISQLPAKPTNEKRGRKDQSILLEAGKDFKRPTLSLSPKTRDASNLDT